MSNPNIKDYAKIGGQRRWQGLSPEEKSAIARKAVNARIAKYQQHSKLDVIIEPIPDTELQERYNILLEKWNIAEYIVGQKGGDLGDMVDEILAEKR